MQDYEGAAEAIVNNAVFDSYIFALMRKWPFEAILIGRNDLFAVSKRISLESNKSVPLLLLNYSDTRKFMAQNANGMKSNDIITYYP